MSPAAAASLRDDAHGGAPSETDAALVAESLAHHGLAVAAADIASLRLTGAWRALPGEFLPLEPVPRRPKAVVGFLLERGLAEPNHTALIHHAALLDEQQTIGLLGTIDVEAFDVPWPEFNHLTRERGLTGEEAEHRLRLEQVASRLEAALRVHEPLLSGVWMSESEPAGIVVGTFGGEKGRVLSEALGTAIGRHVSVVARGFVERDLDRAQDHLAGIAAKRDLTGRFETWGDPITGTVFVETATQEDVAGLRDVGSTTMKEYPRVAVSVEVVEALSQPTANLRGGYNLTRPDGGRECTLGFGVDFRLWPYPGVMTAGHCADNLAFMGVQLDYLYDHEGGPVDAQWNDDSTHTATNDVAVNTGSSVYWLDITGTVPWAAQTIMTTICHNGVISVVYQCGEIITKSLRPSGEGYDAGPYERFVLIDAEVCGGDSGGSVWSDNDAWGVVSGGRSGGGWCVVDESERLQNTIYGAIDFAEDYLVVDVLVN